MFFLSIMIMLGFASGRMGSVSRGFVPDPGNLRPDPVNLRPDPANLRPDPQLERFCSPCRAIQFGSTYLPSVPDVADTSVADPDSYQL